MQTQTQKRTLISLLTLLPLTALAGELSAEAVVKKHLEALGGVEKLKSIQSVSTVTRAQEGDKVTVSTGIRTRAGQLRYDISEGGKQHTKAFDGKTAWITEAGTAKSMDADKAKMMAKKAADFDDALVDYAQKGHRIALLGKAEVSGSKTYQLQLTRSTGEVEVRSIDAATGLELQRVVTGTHEGKAYKKTARYSDFRKVDGVTVTMSTEWENDQGMKGKLVVEDVKLNVKVDPSRFQQPAQS